MSWVIPTDISQMAIAIDIAQMTMTIVLAVVFFALYWNDRKKYILVWALGWSIWSCYLGDLDSSISFIEL